MPALAVKRGTRADDVNAGKGSVAVLETRQLSPVKQENTVNDCSTADTGHARRLAVVMAKIECGHSVPGDFRASKVPWPGTACRLVFRIADVASATDFRVTALEHLAPPAAPRPGPAIPYQRNAVF